MTLQQASKKAGGGGKVRYSAWPAGTYWIVPINELEAYRELLPNDNESGNKAVLTRMLLESDEWECEVTDIQIGCVVVVCGDKKCEVIEIFKKI